MVAMHSWSHDNTLAKQNGDWTNALENTVIYVKSSLSDNTLQYFAGLISF